MHSPSNVEHIEKVRQLAQEIANRRRSEINSNCINNAFLRAKAEIDGQLFTFNLINKEDRGGYGVVKDITGQIRNTYSKTRATYQEANTQNVYKNLKLGEILIKNSSGTHSYKTPGGLRNVTINGKASYVPTIAQYAVDLKFDFSDDYDGSTFIANLRKYLEANTAAGIDEVVDEIKQEQDEEKKQQLLERLHALELDVKNKRDEEERRKTFIRYEGKLRYQPTLDPIQEDIKRKYRFDSTLAIDGGPGTGKTTSLIQRIKFLIDDEAMEEYLDPRMLTKHKIRFEESDPWLFFSPSELLKHFLEDAMTEEGLKANDQRVKVWQSHLDSLVSPNNYRLFNPATDQPFLRYRSKGEFQKRALITSVTKDLKGLIRRFENFTIEEVKQSFSNALEYSGSGYSWDNIINSIKRDLSGKNLRRVSDALRLFMDLERKYEHLSKDIVTPINDLLKSAVADILYRMDDNNIQQNEIDEQLREWFNLRNTADDEELNDVAYDGIEEEEIEEEFEKYKINQIRSAIRRFALNKRSAKFKISKRNRTLIELLPSIEQCPNIDEIADRVIFQTLYYKLTRGVAPNLINKIPVTYKRFRRNEFIEDAKGWDHEILSDILNANPKNKRLHDDEKNLLIYFINERLHEFHARSKARFDDQNHHYFRTFRAVTKPVIGVDEATDFSPLELLCIYSLRDPDIGSVTFSGDLMQRFTQKGLKRWEDMSDLIDGVEVEVLNKSYRQTPTLLELGNALKAEVLGGGEPYVAATPPSELEPKPLALENHSREDLMDWLAERIIEIRNQSDNTLPSIAIFLANESDINDFAHDLGDHDRLFNYNIKVQPCRNGQVLGSSNTVRVFSVEYIKGLEFEAVFFPNIEQMVQKYDDQLMMRYMHVGLSRASFYLGVTSAGSISEVLPASVAIQFQKESDWK